ncbi:aldo/keto reductase [Chloroflexi bacterium TSY]|nr:aldo/keto reductase [Chloroflexi bacterium TSY]
MEYRNLGHNGPQVPVLGFGAWPIGGGMGDVDEQNAIVTVRTAIDSGITLIDTAQAYLTSESVLGKALADGYRERCFLATKVSGKYSPQDIHIAIENSLRALNVDSVDLYQIHGWNPQYPIDESMATMARLQEEGKTRYIGVSNFNAVQMKLALGTSPFQSNQPRYSLLARGIEAEDIPFCKENGIGILAHSPLAKGILTGKYRADYTFPADDERRTKPEFQGERYLRALEAVVRLKTIADDKGITLVQLAIAWLLRTPAVSCVLVGGKNPDQVTEHAGAAGVTFTPDELAAIDEMVSGVSV